MVKEKVNKAAKAKTKTHKEYEVNLPKRKLPLRVEWPAWDWEFWDPDNYFGMFVLGTLLPIMFSIVAAMMTVATLVTTAFGECNTDFAGWTLIVWCLPLASWALLLLIRVLHIRIYAKDNGGTFKVKEVKRLR